MKVSVALATYNSNKYIIEQLDSIRMQSTPVDEVVIVDDCSSDETVSLLHRYIDEFDLQGWSLLRHEKNSGFIQTFTDALNMTSGNIVVLCDHDDVWLEDKIKTISLVFEQNTDCLALATSFIQIDENGNEVRIKQKRNRGNNNLIRRTVHQGRLNKMNLSDVAVYNISPGCTCAVRRCLIDSFEEMGDNKNILPHDWKLNIIAAAKDGLYYLDVPTTKYRIYSSNTIGLGHQSDFEKRKAVISKNCKEKAEAAWIVAEMKGTESDEFKYYKELEGIFLRRSKFMKSENYFKGVGLILKSMKYRGLYESIAMDIVAKIKRKISLRTKE